MYEPDNQLGTPQKGTFYGLYITINFTFDSARLYWQVPGRLLQTKALGVGGECKC